MNEQKNLLLAFVLSVLVLLLYQHFVTGPQMEEAQRQAEIAAQTQVNAPQSSDAPSLEGDMPVISSMGGSQSDSATPSVEEVVPAPRVTIDTPRLMGSISLRGARLDDLVLRNYYDELGDNAQNIVLLNNTRRDDSYFAQFGWAAQAASGIKVPDNSTLWTSDSDTLTPEQPLELTWSNGEGLLFTRIITVDQDYMFSITDSVRNVSDKSVVLAPYGLIARVNTPETSGFAILHEGPLGVLEDELKEVDYDDLREDGNVTYQSIGGWLGITDKYWLTVLIPDQALPIEARFRYRVREGNDRYQVDYLQSEMTVAAGETSEVTTHFFAGAKEVNLISRYETDYNIKLFDRTIDWGWLYFITKPIFYALNFFFGLVGNFGIAILLLTMVIKLLFYPLANKQYVSMTKMKKMQPKVMELRERFKDDKLRMQQETMALYKKEEVNPMAGCLPILLQIPVFFAIYKVLFVSIEMRHTPFFGWIQDLSAPDPLTPVNLFGAIPWDPPSIIAVGVWPILMGLSMWLQMKLNPQQPDPIQRKVFMMMPIFFTFILAQFAVGLVIYWTWNNLLSIAQQWAIMRKMGVSVSDDN